MNKALFSRGPWKHIVNRTTISDADGDRIATVVRKGLYHYTAELIAAAPEMYGLLEEIRGVFAANCCIPCHKCHELQNRIEKLLGKACGSDSASEIAPARQIWHECTDSPETGNRSVLAVTANKTWIRMPVCDLIAFLRGIHRPMIRRWAYIDDLEALK